MTIFHVFKLRTGETLFAELIEESDYTYHLRHPMEAKTFRYSDSQEGLILNKWIPYTDDELFDISAEVVYYVGALSDNYIKFYGSTLLREEITKLDQSGKIRIMAGESRSAIHEEISEKIKNIGIDYSIKYGLEPLEEPKEISIKDIPKDRVLH
jgi:hypothetical protein